MNKKSFAYKNILLNTEFNKYLVEHPEVADKIPNNALVVLLPEDDPPLCRKESGPGSPPQGKESAGGACTGEKIGSPSKVSSGATPT